MCVIEVGPEERYEAVATVEAKGAGGGKIAEQGEQLWPPENGTELPSAGIPEIHSPQHPEPDHSPALAGARR